MITPEQLAKSGSEHGHQAALFCWANSAKEEYSQLKWLFAIPNGGLRDKITAAKLKASGVKSGVPDIFLPVAKQHRFDGYNGSSYVTRHGLFIEMKVGYNKTSDEQEEWIKHLTSAGYMCYVAYGWEDARDCILDYLEKE